MSNRRSQILLFTSIALTGFLFDQFTKFWAVQNLQTPLIFNPWSRFILEKNIGIAFSIAFPYPILIFLNILFFAGLIFFLVKKLNFHHPLSLVIIAFLASGALGNLADRIRLSYVVDFISIGQFPVFNIADSFITVSVFLLLFFYDKINRSN